MRPRPLLFAVLGWFACIAAVSHGSGAKSFRRHLET